MKTKNHPNKDYRNPYYRRLWNQCKKLWDKQGIIFFSANSSVRKKNKEKGSRNNFTHIEDLKDIFPDKDLTTF